jgi:tetratricopeptide (TPR) repeat protein
MVRRPVAALILLLFAACASSGPPSVPNDREWNAIKAEYQKLDMLRKTAPFPAAEMPRRQQIELVLENQKKLSPVYQPFFGKLKEYFERTGDQRAARLYASEKIRIGDDYMFVLARYDSAIALYESALSLDADNAPARERLAQARARRYVTMEVFAAIHQGMKEREIRKLVGMPREDWIKQVAQKGRLYSVWIYPKEDGGASAIYFDNGVVYHTNWNAALPPAKASK